MSSSPVRKMGSGRYLPEYRRGISKELQPAVSGERLDGRRPLNGRAVRGRVLADRDQVVGGPDQFLVVADDDYLLAVRKDPTTNRSSVERSATVEALS